MTRINDEQRARAEARPAAPCRDCGEPFPHDPDADRCPACAADAIGAPLDPDHPGEHGYANRGEPCSWDAAA